MPARMLARKQENLRVYTAILTLIFLIFGIFLLLHLLSDWGKNINKDTSVEQLSLLCLFLVIPINIALVHNLKQTKALFQFINHQQRQQDLFLAKMSHEILTPGNSRDGR